jgi:DNA mismatch endonuclease (patch repair protein)
MSDVLTKEQRSYNMSRIRSKDTKPEEIVRKYLFSRGLRYRKNDKRYPGHPDIVLPKYHTVVFVHGCFWHRHPGCRYASIPATNSEFWQKKFTRNVERDKEEQSKLREMGWKVLIVWECELKKEKREATLSNLYSAITGNY